MAVVVHRVVIVVHKVPAMMWVFSTSIPHIVDDIGMVVIHSSIDDSNDNACTSVAHLPNIISVYLGDVPLVIASVKWGIIGLFTICDVDFGVFHDIFHVGSFRNGNHHVFRHGAADGIDNPKRMDIVY